MMREESVSEAGESRERCVRTHNQSHSSQISHGASSAHDPTMGGEVVRVWNIQSSCRHEFLLCVSCIWKWSRFQTRDSWRLARAKRRRRDGIIECLHYSSQIFSVCVFSLFLYEMEEGRKEGRRLLIGGFFFCLCVLGEEFSAGRERCRTWHIKRKLCGLLSTRSRPAMWVLKRVLFLCILSFSLMGFLSIQMGSESSRFRTENG